MGGKFHLKLNNGKKPIANKYREGKMQRTLKRELKVLEIVKREGDSTSGALCFIIEVTCNFDFES